MRKRGSLPLMAFDEAPCPNPSLKGNCHVYRGGRSTKGYGVTWFRRKWMLAHRYAWELANGPIPAGMEIDHQCRTRACINVNHLRVVTKKVNLTENVIGSCWQRELAKTHCPRGHAYDDANTYRNKSNHRLCRACNRLKAKARRERNRAGI